MGLFFTLVVCELIEAFHPALGHPVGIDHPLSVMVVLINVGRQWLHIALILLGHSESTDELLVLLIELQVPYFLLEVFVHRDVSQFSPRLITDLC